MNLGVVLLAYIITGIALSAYDFSAPAMYKKIYVLDKNYKVMLLNWFLWPVLSIQDVYFSLKEGKSGIRYGAGVLILFVALLLWGHFVYSAVELVTSSLAINYIVCFVALLVLSPVFFGMTLPAHDKH